MARRATSLTKGGTATREQAPVELAESGAKAQRRGPKGKRRDTSSTEMSVTDAFFPGSNEATAIVADPVASEPVKARRGRKPKMQPASEAPPPQDDLGPDIDLQAPEVGSAVESNAASDMTADIVLPSKPASSSPHAHASAARWDAETGTASFDWPSIEQVAASDGPN